MFGKLRSDVLVVGAGPTGLFTALRLAERGVNVRIVDRHWRTGVHSYALALHPRSLELLDQVEVASRLLAHGRRVDRVEFWENGALRGTIELSRLGGDYPFVLVAPQSLLEAELENRLLRQRTKVQWNQRVERVRRESEEMVSEISHLDRIAAGYPIARSEWNVVKTSTISASYLVGADGYHSKLRELLRIDYRQFAPLATYAVFEIEGDRDAGDALKVVIGENAGAVLWPMQGNRVRWSFRIDDPDRFEPKLSRLNQLIESHARGFDPVRGEILWSSAVQFDRRLASGMGSDRIWLAGDAVHLTSPVGVQSMNSGLVDADELSWRLADVLTGERGPDVMASYEAERMEELEPLFVDPAGVPRPDAAPDWVRDHWPGIVTSVPATGPQLLSLLEQLGGAA